MCKQLNTPLPKYCRFTFNVFLCCIHLFISSLIVQLWRHLSLVSHPPAMTSSPLLSSSSYDVIVPDQSVLLEQQNDLNLELSVSKLLCQRKNHGFPVVAKNKVKISSVKLFLFTKTKQKQCYQNTCPIKAMTVYGVALGWAKMSSILLSICRTVILSYLFMGLSAYKTGINLNLIEVGTSSVPGQLHHQWLNHVARNKNKNAKKMLNFELFITWTTLLTNMRYFNSNHSTDVQARIIELARYKVETSVWNPLVLS